MKRYDRAEATLALLRLAPAVPVLTVSSAQEGVALARALLAGGLPVIEVTLRTRGALAAIAAIRREVPEAKVGAGTVVEPGQAEAAVEAGATFLVSPGSTARLAEAAVRSAVPFLPGMATVSEAMALAELGFSAMKFFPAEPAGGAKYLAALQAPLPHLCFCPTGGIDAGKAKAYLALRNVVCVGGSWMLPADAVRTGDYRRIEDLAREAAALSRVSASEVKLVGSG